MDFWLGEKMRLRGVEPSDAEAFWEWDHDTDMNACMDQVWYPGSREMQRQWAMKKATERPANDSYVWVIENREGEMVGAIDSHDCDRRVGAFRYGIAIRSEHRRKGYASEAIRIVLRYFFDELRYQKVTVNIHSDNEPSIRLHERLGFQREGCLRRMGYTRGQYFDELFYGMTVEEYRAGFGAPDFVRGETGELTGVGDVAG